MKLNHTVLPNGAALVAKPPTGMRPGFTVMNLGGQTASGAAAKSPVITEMRDPPVTVILRDGLVKEVR